ncbi:hypothetical protein ACEUCM_17675 [Aeromonas dhakensis]|uniref:hypothetical protein n=1 Tax=Aeromonas dhakensis TaxID=196024 RepID=UPI00279F8394|nr:hypothetical protein P05B_000031 [Aeromonas phage P05B]
MRNIDKEQASVMASSWLLNCNILDTETTGLDDQAEIVEISHQKYALNCWQMGWLSKRKSSGSAGRNNGICERHGR